MVGADRRVYPGTAPLPLVGREREQTILREHFAAAIGGQGSLVLIGGEAGIGKTALAEATCREATEQGATVLTGRCFDLAETPAYGPWLDLFDRYHTDVGLPDSPAAFAERGVVGGMTSQVALFRQVRDFMAALAAARPVVVLLDDLHWGDLASLDLLRFLAQSVDSLSLLIIVTYRADELTRRHPLYQLLPRLVREANAERLDLTALDDTTVRALVTARYTLTEGETGRLVGYLQARAEGNAFFLGELLRALEETGILRRDGERWALGELTHTTVPPLLRQVIDERVARLDAESQRLLIAAAIIGHEIPLDLWAMTAEVAEETLLDVVAQGVHARLLVEAADGERVQFAHALVREALYEGELATRRRRLHRRVAEILAESASPNADAVAHHFRQAGDGRAAEWLILAGRRAERSYAWRTAIDRYEAALVAMERADSVAVARGWLLNRLAVVSRYSNLAKAITYADEAARVAVSGGDRALAAAATFNRGWLRYIAGEYAEVAALLPDGVAALEALSPAELERVKREDDPGSGTYSETGRAELLLFLAQVGRYAEVRDMGERRLHAVAASVPSDAWRAASVAGIYVALGTTCAMFGDPTAARDAFQRARAAFRSADHQVMLAWIPAMELEQVVLPYYTDRLAERDRVRAEAEGAWRQIGDIGRDFAPRLPCAPLLFVEGNWGEAHDLVQAGHSSSHSSMRAIAARVAVQLAYAQGDDAQAWKLIDANLPAGVVTRPGSVGHVTAMTMQRVAVVLALDAGDLAAAKEWLEVHDHFLTWGEAILGSAERHLLWAAYHRAQGDIAMAQWHARRALEHAAEPRQPLALLATRRSLGELHTAGGQFDDAATHLDAALALADACAASYERALTLLAFADLHAAQKQRDLALALLDEIRAICVPLDARPALMHADNLASRLTAAQSGHPSYPAGLTPREAEVLRHIAAGESNQEIADALFLSLRTVNRHIANLYRKIDAHGKADATAFAFRHHLA